MKKENKKVARFFDDLTQKHGFGFKSLAYGSLESQLKKFQALIEVGINKESKVVTVLDVGCGFGDLAEFMKKKNIKFKYKGIDISSKIIKIAKEKRPYLDITMADILEMKGKKLFDYVLCTGFNCVKTGCNWEVLQEAAKRMFGLAKKAVAISSVSNCRINKNKDTYYTSPERFFTYCMKNLTRKIILRHDYLPHDFTVYLYK